MAEDDTIPVLMIRDGWYVDELETVKDYEDAYMFLADAVISIESRVALLKMRDNPDKHEILKAETALRYKQMALNFVTIKWGEKRKAEYLNRKAAILKEEE